jgi:2-C-methyl-D-erythritol 4-phosphate cytidylyltransferase
MSIEHPTNFNSQISANTPKRYAIIVAGGSGSRMQSTVPKQFLLLNGLPVLMHTMQAFYNSQPQPQLILVLPKSYHTYWMHLCADHQFQLPYQLVNGGDSRFQSVKNALNLVPADAVVAVHDAVRPLVSTTIIEDAYNRAIEKGAVVVAVKSRDSIRQATNGQTQSLLRDEIYLVQTPQTFKAGLLKDAYDRPFESCFTDDASVAEKAGHAIHIVEGSYQNFKITFPEDIAIAELLMQ